MYASQQHVSGYLATSNQRDVSRQAAERYAQVSAANESRQERTSAKREARSQRSSAAVATA
jgi:hypothetical protein